jgi:hypothetical protein
MSNQIFSHYEVQFLAADKTVLGTETRPTYQLATAVCNDDSQWPAAAEYAQINTVYRTAVRGIDYGRGSVANRFAGHTPKGVYQFR